MSIRPRMPHRAFTLIELLVVIVVIAVLAAIVIPKFQDQGKRSKEASLKSNLSLIRNAVALFQADTGYYPMSLDDLKASSAPAQGKDAAGTSQNINAADWHGPYIQGAIPNDPVSGAAFTYSTTAPNVGKVSSSASGTASDGTAYSSW